MKTCNELMERAEAQKQLVKDSTEALDKATKRLEAARDAKYKAVHEQNVTAWNAAVKEIAEAEKEKEFAAAKYEDFAKAPAMNEAETNAARDAIREEYHKEMEALKAKVRASINVEMLKEIKAQANALHAEKSAAIRELCVTLHKGVPGIRTEKPMDPETFVHSYEPNNEEETGWAIDKLLTVAEGLDRE